MNDMPQMLQRGLKYKAMPTDQQATQMRQVFGVCRLVYNLALEQRSNYSMAAQVRRVTGCNPTYAQQARELTQLRSEFDYIGCASKSAAQQSLRDLDKAFGNFFAGRAMHPKPRKKFENDTFRIPFSECGLKRLNRNWGAVRLPKIGWVRFRWTRNLPGFGEVSGRILNVTASLKAGEWSVSFASAIDHELGRSCLPAVGIDRGIAVPLALSTGESIALPDSLARIEKKHRQAQRDAAKKTRGSQRWRKAMQRVRKLKARQARIRQHWQHDTTTSVARRFGVIVLENLKTKNMSASAKGTAEAPGRNVRQKAGLNRAILNVGWYGIQQKLTYKAAAFGGEVRLVNPAYTSQTCAECGVIDKQNRENQAVFSCKSCGHTDNADTNAARNILRAGTRPAPSDAVARSSQQCESRRAA